MHIVPVSLAIFGVLLGSSEAVAITYSSSDFSRVISTARLRGGDYPQLYFSVRAGTLWSGTVDLTNEDDGVYYQCSGTAA
jgi:hypothetical protein